MVDRVDRFDRKDFPQVFIYGPQGDEQGAAEDLARKLADLDITAPLVVKSTFGEALGARIKTPLPHVVPVPQANQEWAATLGSRTRRSGADAIIAIGGGRCLDVAKLAAARAGVTVVAVPTQLSHDGICSPVAVVPAQGACGESIGAIAPRMVYLSIPTLLSSPLEAVRAGLGDLVANPLALRDWALAADRGLESIDRRAWDLSVESFDSIEGYLAADVAESAGDARFLMRLADGLVLSGMAMVCAGNSRPASGGEHEISHAIDHLFGGRALHGAQVAFGCLISTELYGGDTQGFRARLAQLGLPQHPSDLSLSEDDMVKILLAAPYMRPGRFTVLEDTDLDEGGCRALLERIWD
ncbi:MAG: iron-containing alcohol dehydrogenase [Actinomycetota bacterium]|nr:iron-containing alcohol dehydrogenase [Actinomycetota bacterium]